MNIGVLGSGAREHALQWVLQKSPDAETVFCLPGNGGTHPNMAVDPMDANAVRAACERLNIDLLVVGPEGPLAAGLVDAFEGHRTRVFGPSQQAARLESSKIWSKAFMQQYGIPTASSAIVNTKEGFATFAAKHGHRAVLKADGLAAGKGVAVCRHREELLRAWKRVAAMGSEGGEGLLAEQVLDGWELSVHILTDGNTWCLFPSSQDHKPLLDQDLGPNTGGMGAFSPVEGCTSGLMAQIAERIIDPTLQGLRDRSIPYCGFLYFGLMITPEGPFLLEYNVRLGDPEAQVLLPALTSDLACSLMCCLDGTLDSHALAFDERVFASVVLASPGYPDAPGIGHLISGIERAAETALVFHAGTTSDHSGLRTSGGRVLGVVGQGETLSEALDQAYTACREIAFSGMHYRTDIGRRSLQ